MKRIVMVLLLVTIGFVYSQEPGYDEYEESSASIHNDASSSDAVIDEIITTEPIIISSIIGTETEEVQGTDNPEQDMTASVEAKFLNTTKSINIPLWYRWKDFTFNAAIPYIYDKKVPTGITADMQEAIYTSSSGLGDISVGASYGKYFAEFDTYVDGNISIKLPTGDEENTEKDDNDNVVGIPLGSGTTDISMGASGFYFMDDFTFKASLLYKMNGNYTVDGDSLAIVDENWNLIEMVYDPETNYGDLFIFNAGADYRLPYRVSVGANITYGMKFSDEISGYDQENGLSFMDISPVAKYSISLFEFVAGAKIPVLTNLETYQDTTWGPSKEIQETRSFAFFFRTNYRIF